MNATTKVIFRIDKQSHDVYALFPEEPSDVFGLYCDCYTRWGHTSADYAHCVATTKLATPDEYRTTQRYLETHFGYKLRVMKRASGRACQIRQAKLPIVKER